ncbi:nuclear transport factor 2 family protein [Thiomonas sp.]|jgi:ketosteroid isomerase-like protein|uniref:YybH family protein n=1 Tax=Thiomonas sp. TaxID=2047785 RepID=UPI00261B627F|nr:nuclear transport factor 2 family protein [Thiomonas sp.]
MPRNPLAANGPLSSAEAAEAAFYEALQAGDAEAVMRVWSEDDEPVCIHPGGPRLVGAAAIRASFEQLLGGGALPVTPERVLRSVSMGCAVHNVVERVSLPRGAPAAFACVLTTNVYLRTPQGWRLVLHHASPGTLDETGELLAQSEQLH